MKYKLEQIAEALKEARKNKGISQRALSEIVSVPQSHISKIESKGVDLRLSSLIEIARALDLEVELVPRKQLSAVRMITKSSKQKRNNEQNAVGATKELQHLENITAELADKAPRIKEIRQLQSVIKELNRFRLQENWLNNIKDISSSLNALKIDSNNLSVIRETTLRLKHLRNQIAHGQVEHSKSNNVPSLYTLDDEDDV